MIEIPSTTDAASAAFVTEALRAGGVIGRDTAVAEVTHEPIGVGVGIVGQLARLGLRYDGPARGAPGSVVLKIPSQYPENRAIGDHFDFYQREGRFYEQIGGKLEVRTPRCYWNHIDPGSQTFALLLEDLGNRTVISQIAGIGAERAGQAVEAIATVHAAWWHSPALESLTWMPRMTDPIMLSAGAQYRQSWPLFVERLGDSLPPGSIELGERVQACFEQLLMTADEESPTTICHGDFRADNLLFDDTAEGVDRVAVLDWQISYRGPAVSDVTYLLCQSMDVDDRRAAERDLLRRWYDTVVRLGPPDVADYDFDTVWRHHRQGVATTTVYAVTAAGSMDPANERGRELVATMARRSFTASLDLDSGELLPD